MKAYFRLGEGSAGTGTSPAHGRRVVGRGKAAAGRRGGYGGVSHRVSAPRRGHRDGQVWGRYVYRGRGRGCGRVRAAPGRVGHMRGRVLGRCSAGAQRSKEHKSAAGRGRKNLWRVLERTSGHCGTVATYTRDVWFLSGLPTPVQPTPPACHTGAGEKGGRFGPSPTPKGRERGGRLHRTTSSPRPYGLCAPLECLRRVLVSRLLFPNLKTHNSPLAPLLCVSRPPTHHLVQPRHPAPRGCLHPRGGVGSPSPLRNTRTTSACIRPLLPRGI